MISLHAVSRFGEQSLGIYELYSDDVLLVKVRSEMISFGAFAGSGAPNLEVL